MGFNAGEQSSGNFNICLGYSSGEDLTTGVANVAVGLGAGLSITTGSNNTLIGTQAGYGLANSAQLNTFVGASTGLLNSNGTLNTLIGSSAMLSADDFLYSTAIGAEAICNDLNKVRIGGTNIITIEGQVDWSFPSDGRFKYNVVDLGISGLEFITQLRPVTYQFDKRKYEEHLLQNFPDSIKDERLARLDFHKTEPLQTGFIAQEIEQVCNDLNYTFSGLHTPQNPTDNYSIAYGSFVPLLVKAIQEQQQQIEILTEQNALLLDRVEALEAQR